MRSGFYVELKNQNKQNQNHYSELKITACSKMGNRENNSELKITVGSRMGPCDVILMMNYKNQKNQKITLN